jgi:hypothetical protein
LPLIVFNATQDPAGSFPAAEVIDDRVVSDLRWHRALLRVVIRNLVARAGSGFDGYLALVGGVSPLALRGSRIADLLVGDVRLLLSFEAGLSVELNLKELAVLWDAPSAVDSFVLLAP